MPRPARAVTPGLSTGAAHSVVIGAAAALLLVLAAAALLMALGPHTVLGGDRTWMTWIAAHRTPTLTSIAVALDQVGGGVLGGIVIPAGVAGFIAWRLGWRAALCLVVAVAGSAFVVQVLKKVVARDRPTAMLVTSDFGSFPSGHVAHAAAMALVIALLARRWWVSVAAALYVMAMMLSRTYLGAHWASDTIAGLLVGGCGAAMAYLAFCRAPSQREEIPRGT